MRTLEQIMFLGINVWLATFKPIAPYFCAINEYKIL